MRKHVRNSADDLQEISSKHTSNQPIRKIRKNLLRVELSLFLMLLIVIISLAVLALS